MLLRNFRNILFSGILTKSSIRFSGKIWYSYSLVTELFNTIIPVAVSSKEYISSQFLTAVQVVNLKREGESSLYSWPERLSC